MKAIGILILTLLLTLSTLSTAENIMVSEMEKTSKVFTIDCEEKYPSIDIEDDKLYFTSFHTSDDILTDEVHDEKTTYFHYSTFSLLKPPKTLFA